MDLRHLPDHLTGVERCERRRLMIERALKADLSAVRVSQDALGSAEENNCEQMFGHVPIPVGAAGPLTVRFSSGQRADVFLPLATTEGALVASVNRGCKALSECDGVRTSSIRHGVTRSIALRMQNAKCKMQNAERQLHKSAKTWKAVGEATSKHLHILSYTIDRHSPYLFLTIACDTDEAMGMNMVTIAADAIGKWIEQHIGELEMVTVAGNVDSDKKPSERTHRLGRGYEAGAEAIISEEVLSSHLKTTASALLKVAKAKLTVGSKVAQAIGANLHAANVIAALYLATGQDAAHVVEGSLADTVVTKADRGIRISVRLPSLLVGVRGGGTSLPAQNQCLKLILKPKTRIHPSAQLAEIIAAAVLAGELSLLAAQATHTLASSHKKLAR
ncbi:TPA: 3-hydroxy-3-methylglutaryl-CoA reductase [Candidatus Peribacteria bacterium]|nr:MAG: hypothetical protein A2529_01480 [Candidatus Peribacteria bacterium RIFOXYD2_FULL_58_15]HAI98393.1 3-hydroxy-3-methylglutaryl-CoA reductase [Candidatus Peribacteria bacterium]HAS33814.1 3-hydroxy-3-methylglutaryl-CoA reductase [Candidatus Peribacteria bacterium]